MNLNGEQAAKIQKFLEEHQGGISKDGELILKSPLYRTRLRLF